LVDELRQEVADLSREVVEIELRLDFMAAGKGRPELTPCTIAGLQRIREPYHLNRRRLRHDPTTPDCQSATTTLRDAATAMHAQAMAELADKKLRSPCRKTLESLLEHRPGLIRFVRDPKLPMDRNASEHVIRGPAMGRKNYYGSDSLWSVCLTAAMVSMAATLKCWDLNPRRWLTWYLQKLCGRRRQTAGRDREFSALEPVGLAASGIGEPSELFLPA